MNDNVRTQTFVAICEARSACKGEPDLLTRVRKAMKVCKGHWMETVPSHQFDAAVVAAFLESGPEDQEHIQQSIDQVKKLNAVMVAAAAGMGIDESTLGPLPDVIPLLGMWRDVDDD